MFTTSMYDRLSEWLANLSLLVLATLVFPVLLGGIDTIGETGVVLRVGGTVVCLWFSLRFARVAGKEI